MGCIYAEQQEYDKAISELKRAIELSPGTPEYIAELGYVYGNSGHDHQAREVLEQLANSRARGEASAYSLAVVYSGLGNREDTLRLLQQAVSERAAGIVKLKVSPFFKKFRDDPEFQNIERQLGL